MSEKQGSNSFFWGFVAGAAATAVYTLLKTPRSGREIIEQARTQANQMLGRSQNVAYDWQQATPSAAQSWQSQAEDLAQQAQRAAADAAQTAQEQAGQAAAAGQAAVEDLAEAASQTLES
jgi:gas vesicle protein